VDDGAQNLEDSLEMVRKAISQGITHLMCPSGDIPLIEPPALPARSILVPADQFHFVKLPPVE
jgi:hypothetical protein